MEPISPARLWTGRVLSGLSVLFLTFDAVVKLLQLPAAVTGTAELGFPESKVLAIGALLLAGVVLHVVPRTAVLGALYITAYLGGAVAAQVRVDNPLLSHVLFPTYVAAMLWGGLVLRRPRLLTVLVGGGA